MQRLRRLSLLDAAIGFYGLYLTVMMGSPMFNMFRSGDFLWRHTDVAIHLGNLNLALVIATGLFLMIGACSRRRLYPFLALLTAIGVMLSMTAMHLWFPLYGLPPSAFDWDNLLIALVMPVLFLFLPALLLFLTRWPRVTPT